MNVPSASATATKRVEVVSDPGNSIDAERNRHALNGHDAAEKSLLNGSANGRAAAPANPAPAEPEDLDDEPEADGIAPGPGPALVVNEKRRFFDRVEAYISRLSTRNNFWHRVCSLVWLPIAAKSGIKMKRIDAKTFMAVLPFRRFNRNWYNAMAGAALLANSEIAGGMYVFGVCGGDYTVVCKHLEYKFLRPCLGPAIYRINPREDIDQLVATRREFNITVDMDIIQQLKKPGARDRRVGRCTATFHVTPKAHQKARMARRAARGHSAA